MISRFWSGVKTSSMKPDVDDWHCSSWWLELAACSGRRRDKWLCPVVELESRGGAVGGDRVSGQELRQRLGDWLWTLDLQEMPDLARRPAFLDVRQRGAEELGDL